MADFLQVTSFDPLTVTSTVNSTNYDTAGLAADALFQARAYADSRLTSQTIVLAATPDVLAVGTITRSSSGAATNFNVVWPDGATGVFTGIESATAPGAIDSYTVTHVSSSTTTYTQPSLTRDANGSVTNRPAITVS